MNGEFRIAESNTPGPAAVAFFNSEGKEIGRLDYSGDTLEFTGNGTLAAGLFFDSVIARNSAEIAMLRQTIKLLEENVRELEEALKR